MLRTCASGLILAASILAAGEACAANTPAPTPTPLTKSVTLQSAAGASTPVTGPWTLDSGNTYTLINNLSNVFTTSTYQFLTSLSSNKAFDYTIFTAAGRLTGGSVSKSGSTASTSIDLPNLHFTSAADQFLKVVVSFGTGSGSVTLGSETFKTTSAVAVPGPVAGAGLPAVLGLLGLGMYWRRRRIAA